MAQVQLPVIQRGFGETMRTDVWWFRPLAVFVSLATFLVYATWAAWQGDHYTYGPYISPFYSPELFGHSQHTLFGPRPAWWPSGIVFSPALLILPFPGLFRLTCYYYRGAYYRAFWADPPACAVGEPRKTYWGESRFPLLLQNVHRYFMYVALLFLVFLAADVYQALWFLDPVTGKESFGIGVGTLVLAGNVVLLSGYTLGCHSFRHVVGGYLDRLSGSRVRRTIYDCSTRLNRGHLKWAWISLMSVPFADLYVRLCSMGIWHDWRIW